MQQLLNIQHRQPKLYLNAFTTTTITVLRPFVQDCPGEPVQEETLIRPWTILIIIQPLSASSIYYDPQHPLVS